MSITISDDVFIGFFLEKLLLYQFLLFCIISSLTVVEQTRGYKRWCYHVL